MPSHHRLELQTEYSAARIDGHPYVLHEWEGCCSELCARHKGLPGAPEFPPTACKRSFWQPWRVSESPQHDSDTSIEGQAIQLFYAKLLRTRTREDTDRLRSRALHAGLGLSDESARRLVKFADHRAGELKSLTSCEAGIKCLRALRSDEFEHCRDIYIRRSISRDVFGSLLLEAREDLTSRGVEVLSKRIDALKLGSLDGQTHALLTLDGAGPEPELEPEPEWCLGVLVRGLVWSRSLHLPAF